MNPNDHKWSKYISKYDQIEQTSVNSPVWRSRFQHPKSLALPLPRQGAPWAHQNMTILRWAAIRSVPYVACCSGIPWSLETSRCFMLFPWGKVRCLAASIKHAYLSESSKMSTCPASKPRGSRGNAKTSNHFLFQQETCPLIALPLERVIGMVIKHIQNGYLDRI